MKKFYCCEYCDELFETKEECEKHEADCSDKADYEESRKCDYDSLMIHLANLIEEIEIFDEAYNCDVLNEILENLTAAKKDSECNCRACKSDCDCDICDDVDDVDDADDAKDVKDTNELSNYIKDLLDSWDDNVTCYINGKEVTVKDIEKMFSDKATASAKSVLKKTDDFLNTILEKLDK